MYLRMGRLLSTRKSLATATSLFILTAGSSTKAGADIADAIFLLRVLSAAGIKVDYLATFHSTRVDEHLKFISMYPFLINPTFSDTA